MLIGAAHIDGLEIQAELANRHNRKTEDITILGITRFGDSPHAEVWSRYKSLAGTDTLGGLRSDCIIKPEFNAELAEKCDGIQWFDRNSIKEVPVEPEETVETVTEQPKKQEQGNLSI